MSETQMKFLVELGELFKKYGVQVDGYDDYDGEENYTGTNYELNGNDISVSEVLQCVSAVKKILLILHLDTHFLLNFGHVSYFSDTRGIRLRGSSTAILKPSVFNL